MMNPDQWRQITAVFHAALERDQGARAAFLDDACRGDASVRSEVERLLAAHHNAEHFGEMPVVTDLGDPPLTIPTQTLQAAVTGSSADLQPAPPELARRVFHPFLWITG